MNNRIKKILAVSLLAAFGITACDDVESRPNKNGASDSTEMIAFKGIDKVYGNNYESLNDEYHGVIASKTLDEILYTYAVGMVAPFNSTVAKTYAKKVEVNGKAVSADSLITLEDVHNKTKGIAEFVKQYKAYEVLKDDGSHDTEKETEYVEARYNAINRAVAKEMYNHIQGELEENKFNEKDFLVHLYSEGNKVQNPYALTEGSYTKDQLLLPEVEPENVFEAGYLHKDFYSSNDNTYVEDVLLPSIYRDILVQQYIFENQENLLGSSYARKVSYVAIKYEGLDNTLYADKLVKAFVKNYLLTAKGDNVLGAFKLLSRIWNGEFMNSDHPENTDEGKFLLENGIVESLSEKNTFVDVANGQAYIIDSAYGDLVEDYAKYDVNPAKSTAKTDYTGGNKYVKEIGFKLESEKIKLNDQTATGWFVKSSSDISSLPDSIKNRLYNLSVATGKNSGTAAVLTNTDGVWADTETNKFITKFNNTTGDKYFLRQSSRKVNAEAYEDIIFNDTASNTYYIINVDEAISPNFMTTCDDYATRIAVAELLSSSDTNIQLAKKYWVEKCNITYHDQSVYDYFEDTFPELFEDD